MLKNTAIYAVTLSTVLLLTVMTSLTPTYAYTLKKSGTAESMKDPGVGHESHQIAIILPPSEKTYSGTLFYTATENVQLVSLRGPLDPNTKYNGPTWTPDGKTIFALTFVDTNKHAGKWLFSGNALAVHTMAKPFAVQYSVQYNEVGPKTEMAPTKSEMPKQSPPTIMIQPSDKPTIKFDKTSYNKGEKLYVEIIIPDASFKEDSLYVFITGPLTKTNPGDQYVAKRVDASSDVFKTTLLPVSKFANPGSGKDTITVVCHCYNKLSAFSQASVTP